jgi:hypothetical protein
MTPEIRRSEPSDSGDSEEDQSEDGLTISPIPVAAQD